MDDKVDPQGERQGDDRRGERRVHRKDRPRLPGDACHGSNIEHLRRRVARRFPKDQPRAGAHRGAHLLQPGQVDDGDVDALGRQQVPQHLCAPRIRHIADHDVIAGIEQLQTQRGDGCHPAGEHQRVVAALQQGEPPLELAAIRVSLAGVDEGAFVAATSGRRESDLPKRGGIVDRRGDARSNGPGHGVGDHPTMHGPRAQTASHQPVVAHGAPALLNRSSVAVHSTAPSGTIG